MIFRTSNQARFCLSQWTDGLKENSLLPSDLTPEFRSPHCTRVKISALGTYVPPKILTNADLEKMVETNDQWITERTGIKERHILEKGQGTSDMAAEAARRCLAARGIAATEVEAIVVGTVTPDMMFPSTACLVQDKIGAKGAWGFDVSAGCCGFVFALQAGRSWWRAARTRRCW